MLSAAHTVPGGWVIKGSRVGYSGVWVEMKNKTFTTTWKPHLQHWRQVYVHMYMYMYNILWWYTIAHPSDPTSAVIL